MVILIYVLRTGEGEIKQLVDLQRVRLKANEYLNMDTILEDTMHLLIIKPLRSVNLSINQ